MDEIVKQALAKWPNVPHCFGWLALDARGDWYMRDERVQHAGPFPLVKGSRVEHPMLLRFIERNYLADGAGAWYFQNGPQRVYLELEAAPWVWRLAAAAGTGDTDADMDADTTPTITSHTGVAAVFRSAWTDETGRLYLDTDIGLGSVHSLDMEAAADAVERGRWQPQAITFAAIPGRFGFQRAPRAAEPGTPGDRADATPPG